MKTARILALLLVAATAVLSTLVYAGPPDPVWASGIFDDDGDNVVGFIVSGTALVEPLPFDADYPTPVVAEYSAQSLAALPVCPVSSSISVRAPPSDPPHA